MNKKTPNVREKRNTPQHGARYVAAHGVRDVLCNDTPLDLAISNQALFAQLERRDRAFARLIAATVFRRLGQIDKVLEPFLKKTPPDLAMAVLRCGAAQILFLQTPPYAAVNGSVALLRRSKKTAHMAGMANAVLRRVGEQGAELLAQTQTLDNIPDWLRTSWQGAYGDAALSAMADMLVQDPPLDITTKPGVPGQNVMVLPDGLVLPGGTVRMDKAGDVQALAGYDDGNWWVQDISAALPVRILSDLVGDLKGKSVLDMCAAPGGKTLQLAAAGADVTALDKNPERLERLQENLDRTGLTANIVVGDGIKWRQPDEADPDRVNQGFVNKGFDCVILDAPCTATGTFRRRPDVLQTKTAQNVDSLARLQEKLLTAAARHVRPGGTLIYCTCSLQPREGEAQIEKFLQKRTDFRHNSLLETNSVKPIRAISAITETSKNGALRILPHFIHEKGGMDGFFIAAFTRC
ncbi:MAG: hypothetical protein COA91_10065 [Robiginitomaculum sp.]|nr:MAG: hypothetical protein COA91_10065 [Robiginitomaculum sp.]